MRVAVIGAGISGIRTCESLLRRGCSVTLLESASGPTQGLSYAPGFLASAWAFHPAFYMKKFSSFRKLPDDSVFIADGVSDRMRNRAFLTGAGQSAANPAFAENLKRFEAFVQASDAGTRKLHAEFGIADGRIDGSLMLLSEAETALMRETFPDRELLSREATLERFPLIDPSLAFAASLLIPEDSTFNATFAAKLLLQRIAEKYGPPLSGKGSGNYLPRRTRGSGGDQRERKDPMRRCSPRLSGRRPAFDFRNRLPGTAYVSHGLHADTGTQRLGSAPGSHGCLARKRIYPLKARPAASRDRPFLPWLSRRERKEGRM